MSEVKIFHARDKKMTNSKICVYIACSLDGFIAGPDNDISWLDQSQDDDDDSSGPQANDTDAIGFETFISRIGAMLMGRNTYDVVDGMDVPWPYGDIPVLVATNRPLEPKAPMVRAVKGEIDELIQAATDAANGKDIYLDGGILIRQALDAGLIDEMIITMIPIVLGQGISLFVGVQKRHQMEFVNFSKYEGKFLQLIVRPKDRETSVK